MKRILPVVAAVWLTVPALHAAEEPAAAEIKQAGIDVPTPERTRLVKPVYPREALSRGEAALVVIELIIDETGKVSDARVLRGVEPFAKAALEAVAQWEFRPTRVDGRPVRVRYTQPISFSAPLPSLKRDKGVPELRQGVAPRFPAEGRGRTTTVTARIEVDAEGRVAEAIVREGESPFSEALLEAIRTWRFASPEGGPVGFDVRAAFAADKIGLDLTDLRRAKPRKTEPAADSKAADAKPADSKPAAATPAAETKPTDPNDEPPAAAAVEAAPPAPVAAPTEPPVEVVRGASPPPPPADPGAPAAAPLPPENGTSNVRDVELSPGIPDLVRGRRPVAPPLARMGETFGDVEIRFSIDSGGVTAVLNVTGRDELKDAAESLVKSWAFRRTAPHRVYALAQVEYRVEGSKARIRPVP